MKKIFEEPVVECVVLHTESITDVISGVPGAGNNPFPNP